LQISLGATGFIVEQGSVDEYIPDDVNLAFFGKLAIKYAP
jgi:hypothetical protein